MGVCGVDYCDEYHLKEYFHKQYGWREDQCDIDKGKYCGRDGLRQGLNHTPCPMDTSDYSRGRDAPRS